KTGDSNRRAAFDPSSERSTNQAQRVARAGEIVVDAAHYQLAAPALRLFGELGAGQPARPDDAVIKRRLVAVSDRAGSKADTLIGDAVAGCGVQIDAGDGGQLDFPAGFLEGFAQRRLG